MAETAIDESGILHLSRARGVDTQQMIYFVAANRGRLLRHQDRGRLVVRHFRNLLKEFTLQQ